MLLPLFWSSLWKPIPTYCVCVLRVYISSLVLSLCCCCPWAFDIYRNYKCHLNWVSIYLNCLPLEYILQLLYIEIIYLHKALYEIDTTRRRVEKKDSVCVCVCAYIIYILYIQYIHIFSIKQSINSNFDFKTLKSSNIQSLIFFFYFFFHHFFGTFNSIFFSVCLFSFLVHSFVCLFVIRMKMHTLIFLLCVCVRYVHANSYISPL